MMVDGKPYGFATGDLRGVDRVENAPHLWPSTLMLSAGLVNPRDDGQLIRGQGRFECEGLCKVSIRILADD